MAHLNYALYIKVISRLAIAGCCLLGNSKSALAQEKASVRQCGTMQVLEHTFGSKPSLKARFQKQTADFQQSVVNRKATETGLGVQGTIVYIPVVFHVVLTNPAVITDKQIQAQLDVLNNDFAGTNSDSQTCLQLLNRCLVKPGSSLNWRNEHPTMSLPMELYALLRHAPYTALSIIVLSTAPWRR